MPVVSKVSTAITLGEIGEATTKPGEPAVNVATGSTALTLPSGVVSTQRYVPGDRREVAENPKPASSAPSVPRTFAPAMSLETPVPVGPVGPVAPAPVDPVGPVAPVAPAPVDPVGPVVPLLPVGPVGPSEGPVGPVDPVDPVGPVGPSAGPVGPVAPVAPSWPS